MIAIYALGIARAHMEPRVDIEATNGMTLRDVLEKIPAPVRVMAQRKELTVILNGTDASALNGFDTILTDGDEIYILPLTHGG